MARRPQHQRVMKDLLTLATSVPYHSIGGLLSRAADVINKQQAELVKLQELLERLLDHRSFWHSAIEIDVYSKGYINGEDFEREACALLGRPYEERQ